MTMGVQSEPLEEHEFVDPVSGRTMLLVFGPEPLAPYDGKHGVRHDGCPLLADVSPELDAFCCTACSTSGRISGAWFMDMWMTRDGAEGDR